MEKTLVPIGVINTPYKKLSECPNNISEDGPICEIVINKEYEKGLLGLKNGTKIMILYWLGEKERPKIKMQVSTHVDSLHLRGIFSLRTPRRPNPIGVAIVSIIKINNNSIFVRGLDCLKGTCLIDIKPAINQEIFETK